MTLAEILMSTFGFTQPHLLPPEAYFQPTDIEVRTSCPALTPQQAKSRLPSRGIENLVAQSSSYIIYQRPTENGVVGKARTFTFRAYKSALPNNNPQNTPDRSKQMGYEEFFNFVIANEVEIIEIYDGNPAIQLGSNPFIIIYRDIKNNLTYYMLDMKQMPDGNIDFVHCERQFERFLVDLLLGYRIEMTLITPSPSQPEHQPPIQGHEEIEI